jgi:hypothetical protein
MQKQDKANKFSWDSFNFMGSTLLPNKKKTLVSPYVAGTKKLLH